MDKTMAFVNSFHLTDSEGNFEGIHLGARVAGVELIRNIVTYGGYGCYHFLLGRGGFSAEDIAKYMSSQGWDPERILIYDGALPLDRMAKTTYHTLYRVDARIDMVLAVRHALGNPLAPAVGIIHTLSYADLMPLWIELLLGHTLPCDALICSSRAAQEGMERTFELLSERLAARLGGKAPVFEGMLPVIPLGVDVEYWKPENDKAGARRQLELPEKSCIILCPARFSTYDKMDLRPLLMAVGRLLPVLGPDFFHVVLVGDDVRHQEADDIKKFVNNLGLAQIVRIDTDGAPSKVRQYYRAADIFVSLADNIQETFGLTVTQAMACGLPTIVSDWDGYKETVVHGETGVRICTYWAECDQQISALGRQRDWLADHLMLAQSVAVDMEDLLEALYFMATRPDLRHRLGEAGRRRAEKLYAWPVVIRQYRDLWDECHDRFEHLDLQAWTREEDEGILMPAYFQQFSHYASEIIAGDTQLTLMPEKLGVISRSGPADNSLLPPMMKTVLHPAVFESLMSHLSDWPVAFGTLVDVTARETGHSQDQVARQIMWLIKYGAVKPIRAIPNAHSVSRELVSI